MICARCVNDLESGACTADSGGPLTGIGSWGMPPVPGIHTDVWYYRKWIEDNALLMNLPNHRGIPFPVALNTMGTYDFLPS
ncbi:GH24380 [Drosophila grimshawi]|uniref:GH24380 n=1 Tax=Drosophila grimshawi TaxID=7222 RepID=B4JM82_DROGR|nr:GH24380 [Drosophila grimshawi]